MTTQRALTPDELDAAVVKVKRNRFPVQYKPETLVCQCGFRTNRVLTGFVHAYIDHGIPMRPGE